MQTTRRQGFTLIELLVVVAIIGILLAVLIFAILPALSRRGDEATRQLFSDIKTAINTWRDKEGKAADTFPASGKNTIAVKDRFAGNLALYKALVSDPLAANKPSYVEEHRKFTAYLNADGSVSETGDDSRRVFVDGHGTPIVYWEWQSKRPRTIESDDPTAPPVIIGGDPKEMKLARNKGSYDLYSAGTDKIWGNEDDLANEGNKFDIESNPFRSKPEEKKTPDKKGT